MVTYHSLRYSQTGPMKPLSQIKGKQKKNGKQKVDPMSNTKNGEGNKSGANEVSVSGLSVQTLKERKKKKENHIFITLSYNIKTLKLSHWIPFRHSLSIPSLFGGIPRVDLGGR